MKKELNRIEIRVFGPKDDQEIGVFLPWDANMDDWTMAFKTILTHQEWSENTIKNLFFDELIHQDIDKESPPEVHYPCGLNDSTRDKAESNYANAY